MFLDYVDTDDVTFKRAPVPPSGGPGEMAMSPPRCARLFLRRGDANPRQDTRQDRQYSTQAFPVVGCLSNAQRSASHEGRLAGTHWLNVGARAV